MIVKAILRCPTHSSALTLPGLLPEAERGVSWQDRSLLLHTQYGSREPTQALGYRER